MKKKLLIYTILILVIIVAIPFVMQTFKFIRTFNNLTRLDIEETPYKVKDSVVVLINIKTNELESIKFNGITLINFWASWCQPCIDEQPSLELFQKKEKDVRVLQFSFDGIEKLKNVLIENQWTLPAYFIDDTSIFKKPVILPLTLLLQKDTVRKIFYGAKDWQTVDFRKFLKDTEK